MKQATLLSMTFPQSWDVPVNPLAKLTEQRVLNWLESREVVADDETRATFKKLDVGRYGGSPFPFARAAEAEIITSYLSLWIFFDDLLEEDSSALEGSLEDAIAGRDVAEGSKLLGCWSELGKVMRAKMGARWSEKHAKNYIEWARSVQPEQAIALEMRAKGLMPSSKDHLARRSVNIGVYPTLDFLEYQDGFELPDAVVNDPSFVALKVKTAELVAIINDLFGFTKDHKNKWVNLVSCIAAEKQCSLTQAFAHAVQMYDDRIKEIERLESKLDTRRHAGLRRWLNGVHYMCAGFTRWHAGAARYKALHVFEDGSSVQLVPEAELPLAMAA